MRKAQWLWNENLGCVDRWTNYNVVHYNNVCTCVVAAHSRAFQQMLTMTVCIPFIVQLDTSPSFLVWLVQIGTGVGRALPTGRRPCHSRSPLRQPPLSASTQLSECGNSLEETERMKKKKRESAPGLEIEKKLQSHILSGGDLWVNSILRLPGTRSSTSSISAGVSCIRFPEITCLHLSGKISWVWQGRTERSRSSRLLPSAGGTRSWETTVNWPSETASLCLSPSPAMFNNNNNNNNNKGNKCCNLSTIFIR